MIKVTRRDFLKGSVAVGVAGALSGTVLNTLRPSKAHAEESGTIGYTPTTCAGCTTWCPVEVKTQTEAGIKRAIDVRGNRNSKRGDATNGDFNIVCPKARIALQEAYDADRVKVPMRRTNNAKGRGVDPHFIPVSWDDAMAEIANKLIAMRDAGNAHKYAYFRGRYTYGRTTLYNAVKEIIGTPNAISHSSICAEAENFARSLAVGRWGYDDYDIDNCRYLLLWGVDPVSSNRLCSGTIKKLGERMNAGMTVVSIDPRLHATAAKAHKWLPVKPGTDGALALAIAHHILVSGLWNKTFAGLDDTVFTAGLDAVVGAVPEKGTKGVVAWWNKVVKNCTPSWAAGITGISSATIKAVAEGFAGGTDDDDKAKAISWLGPGVAMSPNSMYGAWACIMLNALVGSFDHLGGEIQAEPSNSYYTDGVPSTSAYDDGNRKGSMQKITKYVASGYELTMPALEYTSGAYKVGAITPTNRTADAIRDKSPYETKFILSAMSNWPFSCAGASRWEDALTTGNAYNTGDMSAWSASADDTAPPFVVDISTHASEMGMFADIILPGKHVGLEVMASTHQRSGKYKTHSLYNAVIDPVFPDAKNAESEVPWILGQGLDTAGWSYLINYLRTTYPAAMGEPTLSAAADSKDFELVQTKYHATKGGMWSGSTRAQEWDALNGAYGLVPGSTTLYAGNGISQATYSSSQFVSGRGKAWRYAVDGSTRNDNGTATGGTTTTLTDTSKAWTANAWAKAWVIMTSGAAVGEARYILSNTATTLTVAKAFSAAPAASDTYDIAKDCFATFSAKPEFYNANGAIKYGFDAIISAATTPEATTWYEILVATNYDDTAALVGVTDVDKDIAIMPHYEDPNINDGGAPGTYKYTFIDHKSRLNREGRSANAPWYHEFKSCDAGDAKWKDVVKINPTDASALGVKDGDSVRITSPANQTEGIICKVAVWAGVRSGTVAKSYGQGHWAYGRYASKVFGTTPNGGNNNEILPAEWERMSGSTARNACIKVKIVKVV
ncbi:MAG: molybdopterin-dependent oxidoreductase [Thermodesulfovibrionia bacterium]|nr:molybdopterin-dependent oxidoreductase [Thermodesulfovibrionia bacterium]